jgi:putative hydrolase
VTPVEALERVVHCFDRAHDTSFRAKAFVRALDVVRALDPDEVAARAGAGTLTELDGIGGSTATVIVEALAGDAGRPGSYLARVESETKVPISAAGATYREALRGDCHLHTRWSDGSADLRTMALTARALGHEYIVVTDHSPRLTIAHGLDRDRLLAQLAEIAAVNADLAPFRVLTGMEVDILDDGSLDLDDDLLERLDVVVASVHSKLRTGSEEMTERMVRAVRSPHVDVLGHCTGRLIGKRPPSTFDADAVFRACAESATAVEINCRPERLDPPRPLLARAVELGCSVTIDTDAHATGQLEWHPLGCDRAAEVGVPLDRVLNALPADDLLAWGAGGGSR